MRSLCTEPDERAVLNRLLTYVRTRELNGTQAWTCFSSSRVRTFQFIEGGATYRFSAEEKKAAARIKKRLTEHLLKTFKGACAYCKRPVGRYGFGWHVEHVRPKFAMSERTFLLSNLTIGCVDCNRWKASHVDHDPDGHETIINPVAPRFKYGRHLGYVNVATEEICFVKYLQIDDLGTSTWEKLKFREIERAAVIDSINPDVAQLHDRINDFIVKSRTDSEADDLVELLGKLKSSFYKLR